AVLWIYMSWRDPKAKAQIDAAQEKMTAPNSTFECELRWSRRAPRGGGRLPASRDASCI
ncbi:hypothetical protein MNEG_14397, partial [Monoraphidium neglectum]